MNLLDLAIAAKMGGGGGAAFGAQEVVLFPATDLEMHDGAEMGMAGMWLAELVGFEIEAEKTYIVVFNGTPYTVTTVNLGGEGEEMLFAGNVGLYGGEDTGEPFLLGGSGILTTEASVNLMVKGKEIKPLDYEYLPSIPTVDLSFFGNLKHNETRALPIDKRPLVEETLKKAAMRGLCSIILPTIYSAGYEANILHAVQGGVFQFVVLKSHDLYKISCVVALGSCAHAVMFEYDRRFGNLTVFCYVIGSTY